MSIEIDAIDSDMVVQYFPISFSSPTEEDAPHPKVIFSSAQCLWPFMKKAVLSSDLGRIEIETQKIASRKIRGSVEAGATYKWGGKDGDKISGYVSGEVHDDNGNYVKGEVAQNDDGTGSATVAAGHQTE